jgi:HK97 gp10 family phage protein
MASIFKHLSIAAQVRRISGKLNSVAQKCEGPISATLFTQAALVASEQKGLAPVDPTSETPGALRDSIRVEQGTATGKKKFVVKIKAGGQATQRAVKNGKAGFSYSYDYARAIEFGTQDMPAQPFFFPIWRARRKAVRAVVRKAVGIAVRGVFK